MKKSTIIIAFFFLAIGFVGFSSCNSSSSNDDMNTEEVIENIHDGHDHDTEATINETKIDKSGPEYTSKYICPMNCKGSGGNEPGKCPECTMAYIENEDFDEELDD